MELEPDQVWKITYTDPVQIAFDPIKLKVPPLHFDWCIDVPSYIMLHI